MESIFKTSENKLELSPSSIQHLAETAKWSKFLSIIGFVGLALFLVLSLFIGIILPSMNSIEGLDAFQQTEGQLGIGDMAFFGPILAFGYLGIALLHFFPILYLFNFSRKAQIALKEMNSELIETSLNNLKKHYKYIGIMVLVLLVLYAIVFTVGIITGLLTF